MRVYLDHNATTPMHREVIERMRTVMGEAWGNASSVHEPGRRARRMIETAREQVSALIGASAEEVVFTGSGTEADNLAIIGATRAREGSRSHVVLSAIEHHAVLHSGRYLERRGVAVSYAPVDRDGRVAPESVRDLLRDDTALVSVMHANNETGAIQPVEAIGALLADHPAYFHCDAVQTAGKIPIEVDRLGVDLLTISGHKFYGPKGVGALFIRQGTVIQPLIHGGAQESGLRAGTYDAPAIAGLGLAAELARRSLGEDSGYIESLTARLVEGIRRIAPDAVILGDERRRLPNTVLVCFPNKNNQTLIANLDHEGIAVSSGAACSAGDSSPSHVLRAIGVPDELIRGAVRFSLGAGNAVEEIDYTLETLKRVLKRRAGRRLSLPGAVVRAWRRGRNDVETV